MNSSPALQITGNNMISILAAENGNKGFDNGSEKQPIESAIKGSL